MGAAELKQNVIFLIIDHITHARTHAHRFQLHLSLCLQAAEYGCDLLLWYVRFRQFDCKLEIACAYLSLGIQDGLVKLFFHGNIWDLHSFMEFSLWRIIPHQWTMQLWNIQLLYTCSRTFSIRCVKFLVCMRLCVLCWTIK